MRLWSIHPKYLDAAGLVALWRESLLAQAVLRGETTGYKTHPQLERFRSRPSAIASYLREIWREAKRRGYAFDRSRIRGRTRMNVRIAVTRGQLQYEWRHLRRKLRRRSVAKYRSVLRVADPEPHPLFTVCEGGVEPWERR